MKCSVLLTDRINKKEGIIFNNYPFGTFNDNEFYVLHKMYQFCSSSSDLFANATGAILGIKMEEDWKSSGIVFKNRYVCTFT